MKVQISAIGATKVSLSAIGAVKARTSAIGAAKVRISIIGAVKAQVSAIGAVKVQISAIGAEKAHVSATTDIMSRKGQNPNQTAQTTNTGRGQRPAGPALPGQPTTKNVRPPTADPGPRWGPRRIPQRPNGPTRGLLRAEDEFRDNA